MVVVVVVAGLANGGGGGRLPPWETVACFTRRSIEIDINKTYNNHWRCIYNHKIIIGITRWFHSQLNHTYHK